jgi:hypothetical protein
MAHSACGQFQRFGLPRSSVRSGPFGLEVKGVPKLKARARARRWQPHSGSAFSPSGTTRLVEDCQPVRQLSRTALFAAYRSSWTDRTPGHPRAARAGGS